MGIFSRKIEDEPRVEHIAPGDDVAVICSDFPDLVVRGFIVQADAKVQWALVQVWYFDEWVGEFRQIFTWEPIENMRRLDCYLAEGRQIDEAILPKMETAALATAS